MELNVKLTADELMDVVDATMNEASNRGYCCEEDETVDDMLHIVDAALSAMGIEIVPADEDEDEDEEYDPIAEMLYVLDDGRTAISRDDACLLVDQIREVGKMRGLTGEALDAATQIIFLQVGKDYGIDVVDDGQEQEQEEVPKNPIEKLVFIYEGRRAITRHHAELITRAVEESIEEQVGFLPDSVKDSLKYEFLLQVFKDNGVEIVVDANADA